MGRRGGPGADDPPGQCRDIRINNIGDALSARLAALHGRGETPKAIAAILDREGFRPPKRASRFTAGMVRRLLHELGLRPRVPRRAASAAVLSAGEVVVARPGAGPGPIAAHVARVAEEGLDARPPGRRPGRPVGGVGRRDRTGPPAGVEGMPPIVDPSGAAGRIANTGAASRMISSVPIPADAGIGTDFPPHNLLPWRAVCQVHRERTALGARCSLPRGSEPGPARACRGQPGHGPAGRGLAPESSPRRGERGHEASQGRLGRGLLATGTARYRRNYSAVALHGFASSRISRICGM